MNKALIRDELKRDEGLRLKPYLDTEGLWTIGYGRNLSDRGIDATEAEILLADDIATVCAELDREFPWWVTRPDDAQRGLVNMAFNLGISRLSGFKRMLACLQAGDYGGASDAALDSTWAKQVGERATRIAHLFRNCATQGATS